MYVLQIYGSCTFCKRKTRGKTQFWIEHAALYTLTNHNKELLKAVWQDCKAATYTEKTKAEKIYMTLKLEIFTVSVTY